jgi:hypothetical protein
MTIDQLKQRFPHATSDFLRANANDWGLDPLTGNPRALAKLERNPGHGALDSGQIQAATTGRFRVRLTSIRKRLLDQDNLCEKYHVDCCRYAGLLPGDGPATTEIETVQRKADPGEEERVIIELWKI